LDKQIAQYDAELQAAQDAYARDAKLWVKGALATQEHREAERRARVAQAQLAQAQFQKKYRQVLGTRETIAGLDAEAELARREKDLADAQAILNLLEAGTRPEEIEAENARLDRLQAEMHYLEEIQRRFEVCSPVSGLITTSRVKEKIGQYFKEGELICLIQDPSCLQLEITLAEQDVARVQVGQAVQLKARALPFESYSSRVERLAPIAEREELPRGEVAGAGRGEVPGAVRVYGRLPLSSAVLRPGMTGQARIHTDRRSLGAIATDRFLRVLRTEFWW
jgi:putative peptide zinc metalloprotease protein